MPLRPGDVVIDALFGTGLARAPDGEPADAIRAMLRWHAEGVRILAVDLPSGLVQRHRSGLRPVRRGQTGR